MHAPDWCAVRSSSSGKALLRLRSEVHLGRRGKSMLTQHAADQVCRLALVIHLRRLHPTRAHLPFLDLLPVRLSTFKRTLVQKVYNALSAQCFQLRN